MRVESNPPAFLLELRNRGKNMRGIFNYNNGIFRAINKFIDCVFVSILWIIASLPIITFGASTTALYYTVRKVIRYERSGIWKEFWSSFKLNFKQSTIVGIILLVFYTVAVVCLYGVYSSAETMGTFSIILIFLILTACVTVWGIYVFAYTARFIMPTKTILKNCALIELANLASSLLICIVFVIAFFICFFVPIMFIMVPAYFMLICDLILSKIFRKYMSEEDLKQELEWLETEPDVL